MAVPPDNLRDYIEHHRSSYRRFPAPYTVAAFANVLSGWHYHRSHIAPADGDADASVFFDRFTDYVQMKTGVYSLRYWGFIIDGQAGGCAGPTEEPKPAHRQKDVFERAHELYFQIYDAFWNDLEAGRPLKGKPPPDGRY